jgi:hypothetical protein
MELLEEGSTRFPLYYGLYDQGMMYFAERWHGSSDQTEVFARWATARTDKLIGSDLYARLYWYASDIFGIHDLLKETNINWDLMKKSMESISQRYPDPWNNRKFAQLSCGAGDLDEANMFLEQNTPHLAALPWEQAMAQGHCEVATLMPPPQVATAAAQVPAETLTPTAEPQDKPAKTGESLDAQISNYLSAPSLGVLHYSLTSDKAIIPQSLESRAQTSSYRCYDAISKTGERSMYIFLIEDGKIIATLNPPLGKFKGRCETVIDGLNLFRRAAPHPATPDVVAHAAAPAR